MTGITIQLMQKKLRDMHNTMRRDKKDQWKMISDLTKEVSRLRKVVNGGEDSY